MSEDNTEKKLVHLDTSSTSKKNFENSEIEKNEKDDRRLKISILFPKFNNTTETHDFECSFSELKELFSDPKESETKEVSAFTPAIFQDNYRKKDNAISCSTLVYDLDDFPDNVTAADIVEVIQYYQAICYSSFSNKLPNKGARFRVILSLDKDIPARSYSALANSFKAKFGKFSTGIDLSGTNVAQMFYLPAVPIGSKDSFEFKVSDGEPLNWESLIEATHVLQNAKNSLANYGSSPISIGSRNNVATFIVEYLKNTHIRTLSEQFYSSGGDHV